MSYSVTVLPSAEDDFDRLFDHLFERELARDGGDLDYPEQAVAAIRASFSLLKKFLFTCRKAADSSFLRERPHQIAGIFIVPPCRIDEPGRPVGQFVLPRLGQWPDRSVRANLSRGERERGELHESKHDETCFQIHHGLPSTS